MVDRQWYREMRKDACTYKYLIGLECLRMIERERTRDVVLEIPTYLVCVFKKRTKRSNEKEKIYCQLGKISPDVCTLFVCIHS